MRAKTLSSKINSRNFSACTGALIAALWMVSFSCIFPARTSASTDATPLSTAVATAQFEGSFDKLEVTTLGGWAWDAARPNTSIKVQIYDGAKLLATIVADGFREDLKAAGKGDGKHAFNYPLPATLQDGQSHAISIKYEGSSSELPGSPKTKVFTKP
jgi:hypothetical protein